MIIGAHYRQRIRLYTHTSTEGPDTGDAEFGCEMAWNNEPLNAGKELNRLPDALTNPPTF